MNRVEKFLEINKLVYKLKGKNDFNECIISQLIKLSKLKKIEPTPKAEPKIEEIMVEKERMYRNYQGIFLALMCEVKKKPKPMKKIEKKNDGLICKYIENKEKDNSTLHYFSNLMLEIDKKQRLINDI